MASNNSNQLLVPGVEQALDQMKYEIANEFGVQLGAELLHVLTVLLVVKSLNVLVKWLNNN